MPAWAGEWVGVPFRARGRDRAGVDCWGLVRAIYAARYGVDLPSYAADYRDTRNTLELAAVVAGERPEWSEVLPGAEREGDVALLRVRGLPCHVGLVVADGWMVHAEQGTDSVLDRYDGPRWGRRLIGIYRHGSRLR